MESRYYSVYDKKARSYGQIFASPNDESAKREYLVALQDNRSMLNKFPDDFELHYLFTINSESGKVIDNQVVFVCNAVIAEKNEESNE